MIFPLRLEKWDLMQWNMFRLLYWNELKSRSIAKITRELLSLNQMIMIFKNLLIMVDGEGDLAAKNNPKREKAIENHIKWIEMAHELGCHSIRVNLNGEKQKENWIEYSSKSLTKLCSIAEKDKINIIVEKPWRIKLKCKAY